LHAADPPIHRAEAVTRASLAYEVPRAVPVATQSIFTWPTSTR
jgi:hypothetical protein